MRNKIILFLLIGCFFYIFLKLIMIIFDYKSIGASIQVSSLKVVLSQEFMPKDKWVDIFFKQVNEISNENKIDKENFYYSVAVIGGEYLKYNAEAEAIFYSKLDLTDQKNLYNRLTNYTETNDFKKRELSERKYIEHRINVLRNLLNI